MIQIENNLLKEHKSFLFYLNIVTCELRMGFMYATDLFNPDECKKIGEKNMYVFLFNI